VKTFTAPIASIRRDGGTQIRAALDEATVAAYAEAIRAGVKLPPIVVFDDEKTLWLADGFHRIEAELRAGKKNIAIERKPGTQRDAILYAVGANATHGLPRSNADKRRGVEAVLADEEWSQWSDRVIAKAAHVGVELVARVREECAAMRNNVRTDNATHRVTADGREYPIKQRPRDSSPGQPTAAHTPAANPAEEGEEGAGAEREISRTRADTPASVSAAPAPDEPRDRLVNVERLLRDAQAEIAPLLAKGEAMALQGALNDALRVVRMALGDEGAVPTVASEVRKFYAQGYQETPPLQKVGRYSPPKALRIEDESGNELSIDFEPLDDTDAF
jgi:ParB-like chromosome segregation protein Spo0J